MPFSTTPSAVIRSFRDRETEAVANRWLVRKWPIDVQRQALRRLRILDVAKRLEDLRSPPGNRLEKLSGDRAGQYSIRVNDQWRICFRWSEGEVYDVELCDYHS
jgi:proteic killer suppression protein